MNLRQFMTCSIFIALASWTIGCGSDSGSSTSDGAVKHDIAGSTFDVGSALGSDGQSTNQGDATAKNDTTAGTSDSSSPSTKTVGSICTQADKNCGTGLRCMFLDDLSAPKGTCLKECTGNWDDPVCAVAGSNYIPQCWYYEETIGGTTNKFKFCALTCAPGDVSKCPAQHLCQKQQDNSYLCMPQ